MRPITAELIKETFEAGFDGVEVNKGGSGWSLLLPWGRKVSITDAGVDYTGIRQLLPGEVEEDREQLQFELMYFDVETRGCVDIRKCPFFECTKLSGYARAYDLPVDDNTCRPFGIVEAKAEFGEEATVKNNWFPPGWRITVPDVGFVVIGLAGKELYIRRIEGDLYETTLRFLHKKQGYAVVSGKLPFCATWVTHGEMLGIRVIPEIPRTFLSVYLLSHVGWFIGAMVMLPVWGVFPNLEFWKLGLGAYAVAAVAMMAMWGNPRKRGESLVNKFRKTGSRNAKIDDARGRGMLL